MIFCFRSIGCIKIVKIGPMITARGKMSDSSYEMRYVTISDQIHRNHAEINIAFSGKPLAYVNYLTVGNVSFVNLLVTFLVFRRTTSVA